MLLQFTKSILVAADRYLYSIRISVGVCYIDGFLVMFYT